jgi:hypothetical protein
LADPDHLPASSRASAVVPAGTAITGAILAVAFRDHAGLFMTVSIAAALLLVVMVAVAPAVWSRRPAALAVLATLLGRRK